MTIPTAEPGDTPAKFALRRGTPLYFTMFCIEGDLFVTANDASYGQSPDGNPTHDLLFGSRIEPDNAEMMLATMLVAVRARRNQHYTLESTGVVPGRYAPVGGWPTAPEDGQATDEGGHA